MSSGARTICPALALLAFTTAASATEHHYAPAENLEAIDVAALGRATRSIDMAAYILTDVPVIQALAAAGQRGVKVRVYLDQGATEPRGRVAAERAALATAPNVELRAKRKRVLMHLKAYAVDDALLRTGSANFSASGLKQQDNELSLDSDSVTVRQFGAVFEGM